MSPADGANPVRGASWPVVRPPYDRGILTVTVPLSDEHRLENHVEVMEIVSVQDDDGHDDDSADVATDDPSDQLVSAEQG